MFDGKKITSADLAKISAVLEVIGNGLGLLSLEKADVETKDNKDSQDNKAGKTNKDRKNDKDIAVMTLALNNLVRRRMK